MGGCQVLLDRRATRPSHPPTQRVCTAEVPSETGAAHAQQASPRCGDTSHVRFPLRRARRPNRTARHADAARAADVAQCRRRSQRRRRSPMPRRCGPAPATRSGVAASSPVSAVRLVSRRRRPVATVRLVSRRRGLGVVGGATWCRGDAVRYRRAAESRRHDSTADDATRPVPGRYNSAHGPGLAVRGRCDPARAGRCDPARGADLARAGWCESARGVGLVRAGWCDPARAGWWDSACGADLARAGRCDSARGGDATRRRGRRRWNDR